MGPDGDASPAATGHFETGLTDQGWSGANWIRRVTTGNDSTDDWTSRASSSPRCPRARSPAPASTPPRWASTTSTSTASSLARGDNYNYPTEAQYYAFDATDAVTAGQPLALGALYHYWTCTCQGRANGPASNTTLSAAQAAGATNLKVARVNVFDLGDQISVGGETERRSPRSAPRARPARHHRHPALQTAHASGAAVLDYAGPSG